jgi:hypothetical protein
MSARQKSLQRNLRQTPETKKSDIQNLNVISEELFPMPPVDEFSNDLEYNNDSIENDQINRGYSINKKNLNKLNNFKNFY